MGSEEMTRLVNAELKGITEGEEHQQLLRACYNMARRRSLGRKAKESKTARQVLDECIASLRDRYPEAVFRFDPSVFG